jgi:hypothetical protein
VTVEDVAASSVATVRPLESVVKEAVLAFARSGIVAGRLQQYKMAEKDISENEKKTRGRNFYVSKRFNDVPIR